MSVPPSCDAINEQNVSDFWVCILDIRWLAFWTNDVELITLYLTIFALLCSFLTLVLPRLICSSHNWATPLQDLEPQILVLNHLCRGAYEVVLDGLEDRGKYGPKGLGALVPPLEPTVMSLSAAV
jgi:hypothetical protein